MDNALKRPRVVAMAWLVNALLAALPLASIAAVGSPMPTIVLPEVTAPSANAESGKGRPLQVGVPRALPQTATVAATSALLVWRDAGDGRHVARLGIRSTGARAVRLGLLVDKMPAAATLRFYAGEQRAGDGVTGVDITQLVRRNVEAGDNSDDARTWWSPAVAGDEVTMEVELPRGTLPDALQISIPRLSHVFVPV